MSRDRVFTGLAMRLLAVFLLTSMSAVIKLAENHGANLIEIIFWRQLAAVPLLTAWAAASPGGLASLRTQRFGAHALRSMSGLFGMFFTFGAVILLPLAEATTLSFTTPIFATILGALLLKEPTGWHRWSAVVLGFVGVVIVAQPGGGHVSPWGAFVGLMAALMIATVAIQLRSLGRTEAPVTTVFYFSLLSVPPMGLLYLFYWQAHDAFTFALLIAIGLLGGLGQVAFSAALRFAPVSSVMPMDYSGLIWATLYGWLLFDILPPAATWIGAPIIILSGLYIVWRERIRHRQAQDGPAEITAAATRP